MPKQFTYNEAITHNGKFHADDVFSAAFLKILNPEIQIYREHEVPDDYEGLVFDIGWGEFDHHQKRNDRRANGIPYASFGKLWRAFGTMVLPAERCEHIDKILIQPLDAADNGRGSNLLSIMIAQLNPIWDEEEAIDDCFDYAVSVAKAILGCLIRIERMKIQIKWEREYEEKPMKKRIDEIFGEAVVEAMLSTKQGALYQKDIKKCAKIELQKENTFNDNGEPCAAISKIWDEYGSIITQKVAADGVSRGFFGPLNQLIQTNKNDDTLLYIFSYISAYAPNFVSYNKKIIKKWFLQQLRSAEGKLETKEILIKAIQSTKDDEIIVLDSFYPWRNALVQSLAKYVVFPSTRGGYNMHTVPISLEDTQPRLPFPERWCKGDISEAQRDVPDIRFCHKGNFLVTCDTLESCYKIAEYSSKNYLQKHLTKLEKDTLRYVLKYSVYAVDNISSLVKSNFSEYSMEQLQAMKEKLTHIYFRQIEHKEKIKIMQQALQEMVDAKQSERVNSWSLDELLTNI